MLGAILRSPNGDSQYVSKHGPLPILPEIAMNLSLTIGPLIALVAGILILVMPRLLNFIVAIYLIAIGVIGLLGHVKF